MGVPLLLTWLRKRFAESFYPAEGAFVNDCVRGHTDNLYIDLNSLIYQSAAIISGGGGNFSSVGEVEELVLQKLMDLLDHILFDLVQPRALVFIAIDGVSPLGKMSQQRARRRRRPSLSRVAAPSSGMDALWDSNCISVGTAFMSKMTAAIHLYAVSRTERINAKRLETQIHSKVRLASDGRVPAATTRTAPDHRYAIYEPGKPICIVVDGVTRPGEGENKILEVIRRFRGQPAYNPNTTHVICSTDTDVTVSCLVLHEPRIHVLRYEAPVSLGGKENPSYGRHENEVGGCTRARVQDSWASTFFSVHLFREALRKVLGFDAPPPGVCPQDDPDSELAERALHDVVFAMLLFGNDFLPLLGGGIREGTLDALLRILASDFISRHRTVVVAETNQIQFDSACYLLGRLAELMQELGGGPLAIFADGAESSWGFTTNDEAFQQREREKARAMEKKCYCYWTMLQWALQYSAGVVEHWGCYYPYSTAPPLEELRRYCGVLSYDGVVELVAGHHAHLRGRRGGQQAHIHSDGKQYEQPKETVGTVSGAWPTGESLRPPQGGPTDVMVQLLVLIPPRSVGLLPVIFQQHYAEIQEAAEARVEELDLARIQEWCERKKGLLRKEEQTRFHFYQLLSSDSVLCGPPLNAAGKETETASQLRILSKEVVFIAYWSMKTFLSQTEVGTQAALASVAPVMRSLATAPAADGRTLADGDTSKRRAASFFGSKFTSKSGGTSAAVAALQSAPTTTGTAGRAQESSSAPTSSTPEDTQKTSTTTTTSSNGRTEVSPRVPEQQPGAAGGGKSCTSTCEVHLLSDVDGCYFWCVAPCAVLPDPELRRFVGFIEGNRFFIDNSTTLTSRRDGNVSVLSCDTDGKMGVRLRWEVATLPPVVAADSSRPPKGGKSSLLLPGYIPPAVEGTVMQKVKLEREKVVEAGVSADPWRRIASAKRQRSEDGASEGLGLPES